jgi:hypothetical protein
MNYASLELSVEPAEARRAILRRVPGLSVTEFDGRHEFQTRTGFHLAELSATTLPNGERGSILRYRTAMISPIAAHARWKAEAIRSAVDEHRVRSR